MKYYRMIKQNSHFVRLFSKGRAIVLPSLVCYIRRKKASGLCLGIAVSKKIGKAHLRNRAKRVLRVAAAEAVREGLCPCEMILVARSKTPFIKSTEITALLVSALLKEGFISEGNEEA